MSHRLPADEKVGRMEFLLALRRRGISDPAVLRAMDEVPREQFVAPEFVDTAYADQALPIACGQTISQPYVVAYMTEQLAVAPQHRVLEVGTGSGYQAAVLSRLAREVVSVERYRTLAEAARETAGDARLSTMSRSWSATGLPACRSTRPTTASSSRRRPRAIPQALVEQLADGGVMVLPLGPHDGAQQHRQADQGAGRRDARGPDCGAVRAAAAGAGPRIVERFSVAIGFATWPLAVELRR